MTRVRRVALLAAFAGALWLAAAAPALAHANLTGTTPADGSTVEGPPTEVRFAFDEAVRAPVGGLRVYDRSGERVDDAQIDQVAPDVLRIGLEPGLDEGGYVATWRAVSADGHPIRGAIVFSVGGGEIDDGLLARLLGGDDSLVAAVATAVRAVDYTATLLAAGAALWLVAVAGRDERQRARARTWAWRWALAGIVAALVGVVTQAMTQTGLGPLAAASPDVLGQTLVGGFGVATGARIAGLAALAAAVRVTTRRPVGATALVAGGVAALSYVVDGHTRTVEPGWLVVGADVVHLAAVAAWLGGVALLAATLRDRGAVPVESARVVARFSTVATTAAVAATLAGSAMSWALVRSWRALVSTGYGWTLVAKVALVAVVLLLGALNNRVLVPAVARRAAPTGGASDTVPDAATRGDHASTAAWRLLRRVVAVEAVLMLAVVVVTAALVTQRPAAEAAGITGAFDTTVALADDLQVNLVVDPNQAGRNAIHVYVFDETGRPVRDLDELRLRLSQPERDIGPIERDPFVAGPGHWQLDGPELSTPGRWEIEVIAPRGRFEEAATTVPVVVNEP